MPNDKGLPCCDCGKHPRYKSQSKCKRCYNTWYASYKHKSATKPCRACGEIDRSRSGNCRACARRISQINRDASDNSHLLCHRCKHRPRVDKKHCEDCLEKISNNVPVVSKRPKEYVKNWTLKKRYGISLDEFQEMLVAQNYLCDICKDYTRSGNNGCMLGVDHDHDTGKIRKLLCRRCNTGVGLLGENTNWILRAADYLSSHQKGTFV